MRLLLNEIKLNPYFTLREFQSPDTLEVMVHPELLTKLTQLRMDLGVPVKITSGYRTEAHNEAVGGVKHSKHRSGRAADFVVPVAAHHLCMELMNSIGWSYWYYNSDKQYFHAQVG